MKIASFPAVAPPWLSYGLLYFLSAYFGFQEIKEIQVHNMR